MDPRGNGGAFGATCDPLWLGLRSAPVANARASVHCAFVAGQVE